MSPTLATLTEAHLAWLRLRRSPATVSYYYHAYQRLGSFIQDRPEKRVNQWGPLVADAYAQWLRDGGVKAITARHYVDCLAALLNWSLKQDYIKKNPLERYTRPAGKAAPVTGFRLQEVEAMLKVCQHTRAPRRNTAPLLLLLDTGLRSAEVAALTIADLDLSSNSLIVRHGKGDRSRVATFSDGTAEALRRYLFKEHPDYEDQTAPLFVSRGKDRLTKYGLRGMVQLLARRAGIDKERLGPHLLRHAAGEQLILNGASTRMVMALLGHSQLATTQRYLVGVGAEDLRQRRNEISPVSRLKGIR